MKFLSFLIKLLIAVWVIKFVVKVVFGLVVHLLPIVIFLALSVYLYQQYNLYQNKKKKSVYQIK